MGKLNRSGGTRVVLWLGRPARTFGGAASREARAGRPSHGSSFLLPLPVRPLEVLPRLRLLERPLAGALGDFFQRCLFLVGDELVRLLPVLVLLLDKLLRVLVLRLLIDERNVPLVRLPHRPRRLQCGDLRETIGQPLLQLLLARRPQRKARKQC